MSDTAIGVIIAVVYIAGLFPAAYLIGRYAGPRAAPLAILWPPLLPAALLGELLSFVARIGDGHGAASRQRKGL